MKKFSFIVLLFVGLVSVQSQEAHRPAPVKHTTIGFYANPAGRLFLGPTLGVELTTGKFIAELNFRFPKLSIWKWDITVWECDYVATGLGLKYFNRSPKGGFYMGVFGEYFKQANYNELVSEEGYGISYEPSIIDYSLAANIGHKFIFPSGLYLRCGAYLGPTFRRYDYKGHYPAYTPKRYFGMLDLALGFSF